MTLVCQQRPSSASLEADLHLIFDKLKAAGSSIECPWDNSLFGDFKLMSNTKYLLAANFKDNEKVLPHIIREIWRLVSLLPSDNLLVSIYESGSKDQKTGTGSLLASCISCFIHCLFYRASITLILR